MENKDQKTIISVILIVGVLIAGAILLKGSKPLAPANPIKNNSFSNITTITTEDRVFGNRQAKVIFVLYEDFQCPWCGKFFQESEQTVRDTYVKNGDVLLVYRDYAFLGPESVSAAEGAECAGDQGKFWEYHDYLFAHQSGENKGNFSDQRLKSFAQSLGLNSTVFNLCLDSAKYAKTVATSKIEASAAGVNGTPKGFIIKDGEIVDSIDGYLQLGVVQQKIEAALK